MATNGAAGARRASRALLVGLFLAGLAAPAADSLLHRSARGSPEAEGRRAAAVPAWKWQLEPIAAYPRLVETHFADTFGLRNTLLRWNSLQQLRLFGLFPSGSMYLGGEGFWFFADEHSIELMRGTMPFPKEELESWAATLAAQARWCRARGIRYVYAIGPSKEAIYSELVPPKWDRVRPTRYDELVARLAGSEVPLLDLRPAIAEERSRDRAGARDFTYHPLGTHWTERGCFAAYAAIARALSAECGSFVPRAREDFETQLVALPGDTWAARAYVSDVYTQPYFELRPRGGFRQTVAREPLLGQPVVRRRGPDPAQPRVLIFRDSFGFKVDEFLAEQSSLLVQSHEHVFDAALVAEVHPDVVVQLYVDRKLGLAPPVFAPFDEQAELRARFERAMNRAWTLAEDAALAPLGASGALALPPYALDEERCAVLRLALESGRAGRLELACAGACGERVVELELAPGANELFVRLSGRDLAGAPRLRAPDPAGIVLRALELRPEGP